MKSEGFYFLHTWILALPKIFERAKEINLQPVLMFIDLKKAFGSVHRGMMIFSSDLCFFANTDLKYNLSLSSMIIIAIRRDRNER